jgi:hypothetical protein
VAKVWRAHKDARKNIKEQLMALEAELVVQVTKKGREKKEKKKRCFAFRERREEATASPELKHVGALTKPLSGR